MRCELLGKICSENGKWIWASRKCTTSNLKKDRKLFRDTKKMKALDRRSQLKHHPAFGIYLNFNEVSQIDHSFSEISTPMRQTAQIEFFHILWVQMVIAA